MTAAGRADIGFYYQEDTIIAKANEDVPVKVLGAVVQQPISVVCALSDQNIKTPEDLIGKPIGYSGTRVGEVAVGQMLQSVGATLDDVEMIGGETNPDEWNMVELNETLRREIPLQPIVLTEEEKASKDKDAIIERLQDEAMELYHAKEKEFEDFARSQADLPEETLLADDNAAAYKEGIREVERVILLKVIDSKWMNHIDDMDQLRQSIGLQAYGQKDPVVQYKFLGYDMFEEMTKNIRHDTVSALMHVRIQQKVEREQVAKATGTNKDDSVAQGPYKRKEAKIGRNDPCPCGSGKKYKQCCGRFAE